MINNPATIFCTWLAFAHAPNGGESLYLDDTQAQEFNTDPDAYVARHYGMVKDDYLEWCRLDGMALCGGVTKRGRQCRAER